MKRKNKTENTKDKDVNKDIDNTENEEESMTAGQKVFEAVRSVFVYLLAAVILVSAFLFAADRSPDKSLFGFRYYIVLTDSMVPEFASGDMVFVKIENANAISVGDIITFNPSADSEAYLTHRVTEKIENYEGTGVTCFRTRGDANDSTDSFLIDESRVIGTVKFYVPKLGVIVRFIQLKWYFVAALVVLIVIFFSLLSSYFNSDNDEPDESEEGGRKVTGSGKATPQNG